MRGNYGIRLSNGVAAGYLARNSYRRREGVHRKNPTSTSRGKLGSVPPVEMDRAACLEEKGEAELVYMHASFVHQAHGPT